MNELIDEDECSDGCNRGCKHDKSDEQDWKVIPDFPSHLKEGFER